MGTDSPDHIVVGLSECFYVTSCDILLNDEDTLSGKTLYFPLIYAALLDPKEATAVIGHELGHFTGEDTTYSLHFTPIYAGLQQSIHHVMTQIRDFYSLLIMRPSIYLGIYFLEQFDFAVNHWSRIREFEADKIGASVSSNEAQASALLRVLVVSDDMNSVLEAFCNQELSSHNLLSSVMQKLREKPLANAQDFLAQATQHPSDSHPPTQDRIAALGIAVTPYLLATASRTVGNDDYSNIQHLFPDAKALSEKLTVELLTAIRTYQQARTEILEGALHEINAPSVIWLSERRQGFIIFMAMTVVFLLLSVLAFVANIPELQLALLPTFLFGFFAYKNRYTGKVPMLGFEHHHLLSAGLATPYPLHFIEDYLIRNNNSAYTITFTLTEDAPEPQLGRKTPSFKYKAKKRQILIMMSGATTKADGKLSLTQLDDVIRTQFMAAQWQHELEQHNHS